MNPIKLARVHAGLGLAEAAERAEVGRTTLSRLENGHIGNPSAPVLSKLARTYGVSVSQLVGVESLPAKDAA